MTPPEWNRDDKQGSVRNWMLALNDEARLQFLEAGTHLEIFFIFGDDGLQKIAPIVGMDKPSVVHELKTTLNELNAYAFIHIAEATAQNLDSADEADMLFVHTESRDGLSVACCNMVVQQGDKKLLMDPVEVEGSKLGGQFAHVFDSL